MSLRNGLSYFYHGLRVARPLLLVSVTQHKICIGMHLLHIILCLQCWAFFSSMLARHLSISWLILMQATQLLLLLAVPKVSITITSVFFRNIICARAKKKTTKKNFRPMRDVKMLDVKTCYDKLWHNHMHDIPQNCKDFCGFNLEQLDSACQQLYINTYIFDYEITSRGCNGSPVCLSWHSKFVESDIRLNMLRYEGHLMFIKELKSLFK